jgi:cysteine-rich repeat protein
MTAKLAQIRISSGFIIASAIALACIAPGCGSDEPVGTVTASGGSNGGGAAGKSGGGSAGKAGNAGTAGTNGGRGGVGGGDASVGGTGGAGGRGSGGRHVDSGTPDHSVTPEAGRHDAADAHQGPRCGDGHLDPGEQCDDGNTLDEDDCTSTCLDNKTCLGCVANNCPLGPVYQPKCSDFSDQASKDACYKVFACLMRTECWRLGSLKCYCGNTLLADCKDGSGTGDCKKDIDEAFAAAPVDLVVTDSNAIVTNIGRVDIPAASALSLSDCQWKYCYDPALTSGNWECDPKHWIDAGTDAH